MVKKNTFLKGNSFMNVSDTQLVIFYSKIRFTVYFRLLILEFSNICSISLLRRGRVTELSVLEVTTSTSMGLMMLRLARVVSQSPAQYFGKLPGFNL